MSRRFGEEGRQLSYGSYLSDDHDELLVERQIGRKAGTGGSSAVEYLRVTLGKRFYPELWEVRSAL